MGTDRGRLRAGLGHVHPPGRRRHRPRPRHLARHSRRRARLHRPRQRRVPPPAGRPHQPHPPRAHGSPRPPHGPRLHQLQHPNSDRRPKGRRGVLVSRDSTNGPMTAPMPIAPSSSPKAARPDPQLPASTTSNALVAPADRAASNWTSVSSRSSRRPPAAESPRRPGHATALRWEGTSPRPPTPLPRPARLLQGAGGRGRHPAVDAQAQDEVAAAVRLEIADAVRDMEAALAGRKLVWVKRGLWARRLSAAAVAPYAGAVPTVGAGWGPLLSVTSGIAGHPRHERDPKPGSRRVRLPPSPGQGLS